MATIPDGPEDKLVTNSIDQDELKRPSVKIQESQNAYIESISEENGYEVEGEAFYDEDFQSEFPDEEDILSMKSKKIQVKNETTQLLPVDEDFFNLGTFEWGIESFDTMGSAQTYIEAEMEINSRDGFFEKLGNVPDVSDISSGSIDLDGVKRKKKDLPASTSLFGKFVDPLTGEFISSDESEGTLKVASQKQIDIEEIVEEEHAKSEDVSEISFEDFDRRFPHPVIKPIMAESTQEEVALMFAEQAQVIHDVPIVIHIDHTVTMDFEEEVKKFLGDLVNWVMRYCDDEQNMQLIRTKLNKHLLFSEIRKTFGELDIEKKVNQFLMRKCAEHQRRKGNYRYLQEERPDRILADMATYKEKIDYLNHLLGKEQQMGRDIHKKIFNLSIQADEAEEETKAEITAFENLVRKSFKCETKPYLEKIINKDLNHIASLRSEISAARSISIQRQHTLGTLKAKMHDLEHIGDGLCVADYESLQREMQALGKKIEDRNVELNKMHYRFHHNLHSMAHMQLKSEITIQNNEIQKNLLQELEEEERLTREQLFKLNVKHKNTRRKLADTSLQSGLLDKPALLRDYDETAARLATQHKKLQELRKTQIKLEEKLKHLQKSQNQMDAKANLNKSKNFKLKSETMALNGLQGISLNF